MPPAPPNLGQILLLIGAMLLLTAGIIFSLARIKWESRAVRIAAKSLDYWAICMALAALIWRAINRQDWIPLDDNFEALTCLGILLAGFSMYVQAARRIAGLDWFLLPIAVLMLGSAVIFGRFRPDTYRADSIWSLSHRLSSYGGAVAFAVAAAVGCIYLIASARLRRKPKPGELSLGSLERLEKLTHGAAILGFALLTIGMATGLVMIIHKGNYTELGAHWLSSPKVLLAASVWLVYAVALHTPITPAVRGRKSAMLSIVGFVLMFATVIAAQFVSGSR